MSVISLSWHHERRERDDLHDRVLADCSPVSGVLAHHPLGRRTVQPRLVEPIIVGIIAAEAVRAHHVGRSDEAVAMAATDALAAWAAAVERSRLA